MQIAYQKEIAIRTVFKIIKVLSENNFNCIKKKFTKISSVYIYWHAFLKEVLHLLASILI